MIRRDVVDLARQHGMHEDELQNVALAVSEAATNAIVHGQPDPESGVMVRAERSDQELCVVVADRGRGMLPRPGSPGLGLGLAIISSVARRLEIVSRGRDGNTEVHMYFPLAAQLAGCGC